MLSSMEAVLRDLNDADFLNGNADGSLVDRAGFLAQIAQPCPVAAHVTRG